MRVEGYRAYRLQSRARRSPALPFTVVDPNVLCERVRVELFPSLRERTACYFVEQRTLACIVLPDPPLRAEIFIHSILNRADVPVEVLRHILVHELIHLSVPPEKVEGRLSDHPPAFWRMERALSVDGPRAWTWLYACFPGVLHRDKKNEEIRVKRGWKETASWGVPGWEATQDS